MESENTMWKVFSVYHIPTTSDYLQIDFYDKFEFLEFANKADASKVEENKAE